MTIAQFIPTLQPTVEQINGQLRFICFFVLTVSIIVRTGTGSTDLNHLVRPIMTNAIICGFIATLPTWFNLLRDSFWSIAVQIQQDFTGSIDGTGTRLMQSLQPPNGQINWLDVSGSVWRAVQYALAWVIVWIGAIIQVPMMFVEYIMECLCYLFLPIAISLFAFESTKGIALRYIQQTIAVFAWPIGFAVVDLVGNSLLNSIATAVAAGGAVVVGTATEWGPASFLIAGFVAVWLILGSLATPLVMQALFCSGSPISSVVGHAIQYGTAAAGLARLGGKGGGGNAVGTGGNTQPPSGSQSSPPSTPPAPSPAGGGPLAPIYTPTSSLPALMGPLQRAALMPPASTATAALPDEPEPSAPPVMAAALPPRGHTQLRSSAPVIDLASDPSGAAFAMSVQELNQIPTAIAY